jgi:phospholipid/cholesterol/gamma-HCH transport system permease protein
MKPVGHEKSTECCQVSAGTLCITPGSRLDAETAGPLWRKTLDALQSDDVRQVDVQAEQVTYCDVTGIVFLMDIRARCEARRMAFALHDFPEQFEHLFDLFDPDALQDRAVKKTQRSSLPEEVGATAAALWRDMRAMVSFTGECCCAAVYALTHPARARCGEMLLIIEKAGVNAFPIVAMLGFLLGLILAFQSAVPMAQFGAGIYVSNLVSISLLRELGPLITAIILAGRSGSAFAAELGTMKVNDEINALLIMGFNPVRFLAVPRVLAAMIVMPLLTVFANLFGLIGAGIVVCGMGYPLVTYYNRVLSSVHVNDFVGGLFKAVVFGMLVAGIGCLRGLQTGSGAQAVGDSTTRSVVSGIVLIVVTDGLFAVLFYHLGI